MAAHYFHVLFHVVFQKILLVSKILFIHTSISKIFAARLEPVTIRLYFHDFIGYPALPFMIRFDFSCTLVKSLNWKRRHIGIRIFIRII